MANRIIDFIQKNGFINESVQKTGIPGIPGCIEHILYDTWDDLQEPKRMKEKVAVVWLDLANAYGSVPHDMIKKRMELFWIPEPIQQFVMKYYSLFKMRFITTEFTTGWDCGRMYDISHFVRVSHGTIAASFEHQQPKYPKTESIHGRYSSEDNRSRTNARSIRRLDELINWSDMKSSQEILKYTIDQRKAV